MSTARVPTLADHPVVTTVLYAAAVVEIEAICCRKQVARGSIPGEAERAEPPEDTR